MPEAEFDKNVLNISQQLKKRYFQRTRTIIEDGDWTTTKMSRYCKPLLILLPFTGISLDADRKLIHKFFQWIYIVIMVIAGALYSAIQFHSISKGNLQASRIWYFMYSDHYQVLAVAYLAAFKNRQISQVIRKIWRLYRETIEGKKSLKKLQIRAWILLVTIIVFVVILNGLTILGIARNSLIKDTQTFSFTYFGLMLNDTTAINVIDAISQFIGVFNLTIFSIFGCCLIILCFLLKECYVGLNHKLKSKGETFWIEFLNDHQEITNTVEKFNDTFSPAILLMVALYIIQIVALLQSLYYWISLREIASAINDATSLTKMLIEFLMLARYGSDLRSEAQNGIKILLEVSTVEKDHEVNENQNHEKNCRTINLFLAHTTTSPACISASNLFTVDYSLITILVTITFTYITFIPLLSEGQNGQRQTVHSTASPTSSEIIDFHQLITSRTDRT